MEANQLTFILEELRFSSVFPAEVLDHLAAESAVEQASAGAVVFREGQSYDKLYLVRSGRVGLDMNVPGRGAVRILTLGPGEMVGWSSLLDQGRMTASAVALEDTEFIVAPSSKLRELCEANHEFGFHLMRQMADALSKRLVATRLQLLDLFADSPSPVPVNTSEGAG